VAEADSRWRIYLFAPKEDSATGDSAIRRLADWLERDPDSPVVQYTRKGEDIDGLFDVRAVFQQTFDRLEYGDMPALLRPCTGRLGLRDYEKVFCVDHKGLGDIFDMRGIDRDSGCMVVVRPDQYTAHVLPLDAGHELARFFAGFLQLPEE
jgi:phenol 2-monooxygenase